MNRREFIKSGAVLGGAAAMSFAEKAGEREKPLKVCVFADLHFAPGVYTNDTPEFLEGILARAEAEKCDMLSAPRERGLLRIPWFENLFSVIAHW